MTVRPRRGVPWAQEALKHHHLRAMALVDRHAAPLVHYLADRVLQAPRGDSLVLCRVSAPPRPPRPPRRALATSACAPCRQPRRRSPPSHAVQTVLRDSVASA